MAGASSDLYDLCAAYLAGCVVCLADTPDGPPARAFVSPGPPAWDCCDQLTVHTTGPSVGDTSPTSPALQPGHRVMTTFEVLVVSMTATILRCVPTLGDQGALPTVASFAGPSLQVTSDLWAIWNGLRQMKRDSTLFGPGEREVFFDQPQAVNQQGGCGGWEIPIRVQLNGYHFA